MRSVPESSKPVVAATAPAADCNCGQDPVALLMQVFVDLMMSPAMDPGQTSRPVFRRLYGVARAELVIAPDLPPELRAGVFAGAQYPAWVRFSRDAHPPAIPEETATAGIAIKLFGVPGAKVHAPDANATTHDFILQNHDVFFVDTAQDMCELTCAQMTGQDQAYLQSHPLTREILAAMAKPVTSVLETIYWSVLPYAFGPDRYVKYKLVPAEMPATGTVGAGFQPAPPTNPADLGDDLARRLRQGEARFDFFVQFRTDPAVMPLDAATVRWEEAASPPRLVATLVIPRQDIAAPGQAAYGENLAFDPWHALPTHAPVGSIAAVRQLLYQAAADRRRNAAGIPIGEPVGPRPL